jgi:hypothetical protein
MFNCAALYMNLYNSKHLLKLKVKYPSASMMAWRTNSTYSIHRHTMETWGQLQISLLQSHGVDSPVNEASRSTGHHIVNRRQ